MEISVIAGPFSYASGCIDIAVTASCPLAYLARIVLTDFVAGIGIRA